MKSRSLAFHLALAAGIVCALSVVYVAFALSDDRPPIIVRGGSIEFQGGDPASQNPADCCNNWKKDALSDEWKPDPDNKAAVRQFAVTITGVPTEVCSMKDLLGHEVTIYFQYGAVRDRDWTIYRFLVERKNGFGKKEPKLAPPGALTVHNSTDPKLPGLLKDERPGFISGIRVDGAACGFAEWNRPTLEIRIQPKIDG